MTSVSEAQWTKWVTILTDILNQADAHGETMFAIHVNSAIETAHARAGNEEVTAERLQQFSAAQNL